MPRAKNEWLAQVPDDWETNLGFHGFGRRASDKTYVVTLSCLQTQYHLAFHKDQVEAAKAYDAALWLLLPFAPTHAKPNFPNDFESISLDDVKSLCPYAIEVSGELSDRAVTSGIDVEKLRETRMESLRAKQTLDALPSIPEENPQNRAMKGYDAFTESIAHNVSDLTLLAGKFDARTLSLDFRKIPQISTTIAEASHLMHQLAAKLVTLRTHLKEHREYYQRLKSGTFYN